MKKVILAALTFVALSAARASAATIDFTNAAWNPRGNDVFTVGNVTVEAVSPSGQLYWYNGFEVASEASSTFGAVAALRVTFGEAFTLTSFRLGLGGSPLPGGGFMPEVAHYNINGVGWQAVEGIPGGDLTVNVAPTLVTSIVFGYDGFRRSDFAVYNVTGDFETQPAAVPEPTSVVLLGSGLLGLVARARRKKA